MSWGIVIAVIIFLSLTSSGGAFFGKRNRNARGPRNINQRATNEILKIYSKFIDDFVTRDDKKINLNWLDIEENFNHFPFDSDFLNLKTKLKNEDLSSYIESISLKYNNVFSSYQENLLIQLASGQFEISYYDCSNSLQNFCELSFKIYCKYFIQGFLRTTAVVGKNKTNLEYNKINSISEAYESEIENLFFKILQDVDNMINYQNNRQNSNYQYNSHSEVNKEEDLEKAYKSLNLKSSASEDEIKKSYRQLAKKYHPDRNKTESAKQKMSEINVAYELIKQKRGF